MVLDEDALEAMLRRQSMGGERRPKATEKTHETEEFEVYERPVVEDNLEIAPEPPLPVTAEPELIDVPVPDLGFIPEPVPEPIPEPAPAFEVPEVPLHAPPAPEPTPEPTPEPIPEPAVTPRTHSPNPTAHNFAPAPVASAPGTGPRVAIIQAQFNQELTEMMAELAKAKTLKLGGEVAVHLTVPGVYDLPLLTQKMLERDDVDAAVVLGVVVSGETKHDELITHATAHTLQKVSLDLGKPIGLGITGPGMTWAQAEARVANGAHAVEAAVAQWQALQTA